MSLVFYNRFKLRPGVRVTFSYPRPDGRGSYILVVVCDDNVPFTYKSIRSIVEDLYQ